MSCAADEAVRNLVHSPAVGTNVTLNTLFSNYFNLCFFVNVRDQLSHPYKTKGKIIFYCCLQ
jgi:hypothetical protein